MILWYNFLLKSTVPFQFGSEKSSEEEKIKFNKEVLSVPGSMAEALRNAKKISDDQFAAHQNKKKKEEEMTLITMFREVFGQRFFPQRPPIILSWMEKYELPWDYQGFCNCCKGNDNPPTTPREVRKDSYLEKLIKVFQITFPGENSPVFCRECLEKLKKI